MEETKSEYRERRRTDLRQKQALPLRAKALTAAWLDTLLEEP